MVTIVVLLALLTLIDDSLRLIWGERFSWCKSLLFLFSILSGLYQIAFICHFPLLFAFIDVTAIFLCLFFWRPILKRLKLYYNVLCIQPWRRGDRLLYILYLFLIYLFFLSIFSVPGWNWDSMIFHLPRPFLYLNEGTIFSPHYSDDRQVAWPMGADVLIYLFTRHGETFGVGFLEFIFYIGTLIAVYQSVQDTKGSKMAMTLTWIVASMPVLVYCATSEKSDTHTIFTFIMMWLLYDSFRQSRNRIDLYLLFLALAFGLTSKISFLLLGPLSLITFLILEVVTPPQQMKLTGPRFSKTALIVFLLLLLLLSQAHLYPYNLITMGHLAGGEQLVTHAKLSLQEGWFGPIQNFIKNQLMLFDFVLPLSTIGIPFVDTLLSSLYNHVIGLFTAMVPWNYHYFPEEMRASFGPFGILALWGTYSTCFKKSATTLRALAVLCTLWMFYISFRFVWAPVSVIRYFAPTLIASFIFFPAIHENRLLKHHALIRWSCIGLLAFCCIMNYAKPLIAYHPKAVPWYYYAFDDRHYLYQHKYFLDNRMDIYRQFTKPEAKVLVFAEMSDWVFPYYEYAPKAKVRLANFEHGKKNWSYLDFHHYDFIVCNSLKCIEEWDQKEGFEKVWTNPPILNKDPQFIEKKAAFYKLKQPL